MGVVARHKAPTPGSHKVVLVPQGISPKIKTCLLCLPQVHWLSTTAVKESTPGAGCLPGRVVTCKSNVSAKGQGQREENLGGCIQPHPGILKNVHLE